jgi:hypothetical protein
LIEIEGIQDKSCLVPRRAKFFILNFSPKDHKFQIIQFYEIEGLLFDKILAKSPKDKTEKSFLEGICPANDDFDDCPKLINYFIFYNISLLKKDERAIVSFGQVFCFDGYASDQYFKKGVELMGFSPEDYGWYFPTKAEISF